jgi:putative toxin-antitoxin system antitoxin component (TIGR02293 family)
MPPTTGKATLPRPRRSSSKRNPIPTRVQEPAEIAYGRGTAFNAYIERISRATPMELVLTERAGVHARLIKDLARHMAIPASRLFAILGVAKATAEKKVAADETIGGQGGQAVMGMVRLLGIAQAMTASSTADEAKDFDAAKWLGRWIDIPQPSLGGRKPADLLDTPTGVEIVARLLGAVESGAYQ